MDILDTGTFDEPTLGYSTMPKKLKTMSIHTEDASEASNLLAAYTALRVLHMDGADYYVESVTIQGGKTYTFHLAEVAVSPLMVAP